MKVCAWFLLFTIFALTYTAEAQPRKKKKGISLSLQTVLDFDDKDKNDSNIVDIIQNFMQKLNTALSKNNNKKQAVIRKFRQARDKTFTDFLQEAIEIVNGYDDDDFGEFFGVLNDEIKKYHYRGCKFYELTDNLDTRRLLDAKLDLIKGKSISVTKANINALAYVLRDELYDDNVKEFLDHVNSLYKNNSEEKFQKVLDELEEYRSKSTRTDNTLVRIVKDGLRSVVFDHYTNLNVKTRRELKNKIEKFWTKFKKTQSNSDETNDDSDSTEIKNKAKVSEKLVIAGKSDKRNKKDKKTKELSSSDESRSLNEESTIKSVKKQESNHKNSMEHHLSSLSSEKVLSSEKFESNSIEFSLERQQQYNTQRYATLYTESITETPQKTNKKAKNMKSRSKPSQKKKKYRSDKKKQTTKSETEIEVRETQMPSDLRMNKELKDLKQKKPDTVKAMDNNNKPLFRAYDTKVRGVDPVEETDAGSDIAPESTELKQPTNSRRRINSKPVHPREHPQKIRLEARFGGNSNERTPTDQRDLRRDNSVPHSSNEGLSIEMFKRERDAGVSLRKSNINNTNLNPAEVIFLKRINDLEKEINEVKHKIDDGEDKVNITTANNNKTEKLKGNNDIVKLVDGNNDNKAKKIGKETSKYTIDKTNKNAKNSSKVTSLSKSLKLDAKDSYNNSIDGRKNLISINTTKTTNITDISKKSTMKVKNATATSTADNVTTLKNEVSSGRSRRELAFSSPPHDFDFVHKKEEIDNTVYDEKIPFIKNIESNIKYRRYYDFKG